MHENKGLISTIFKLLEKQGHKKDYINKITCLLKRIELYNGKVERTKIIELIDNKSNLLTSNPDTTSYSNCKLTNWPSKISTVSFKLFTGDDGTELEIGVGLMDGAL